MSANRNKDLARRFKSAESYQVSPPLQKAFDDNDGIVFSFQFLQKKYDLDNKSLSKDNKIQLLKKLVGISKTSWSSLVLKDKKSGFERLNKNAISSLPSIITDDIDKLYVLRFASQECRLIGFRQGNIYHILYIDPDLSLYKH
jgi:hypothetical protein